jgi:predicted RNA-binding protein with PIN domain
MRFILDGYNVIGHLHHVSLADKHKIDQFVSWLIQFRKPNQSFTVVFDGQNKWLEFNSTQKLPGITLVHTASSQTADDYIKQKMATKKDKSSLTVVTSDREILYAAKKNNVATMTSDDFILWYTRPSSDAVTSKISPKITPEHIDEWLNEFKGSPKTVEKQSHVTSYGENDQNIHLNGAQ